MVAITVKPCSCCRARTSLSTFCWFPRSSAAVGSSKQQDAGLLGESSGYHCSLALTARQRLHGASFETGQVEAF